MDLTIWLRKCLGDLLNARISSGLLIQTKSKTKVAAPGRDGHFSIMRATIAYC
jgi:hypothetical protein